MVEKFVRMYPLSGQPIEYYQKKDWYSFVESSSDFMQYARDAALKLSKTSIFPIGIVAVKDGRMVGEAGNGSGYHEVNQNSPGHKKGCIRRFLSEERERNGLSKFRSGEGFELCPGCSTDFHAEANLIRSVGNKSLLSGADVYMYGHFWCCEECWAKMKEVKIKRVFLCKDIDFSDKENVKSLANDLELYRNHDKA